MSSLFKKTGYHIFFNFMVCLLLMPATHALALDNNGTGCTRLDLQEAIDIALRNNPGFLALKAQYEARSNIPPQVGSLPDPVLSFNALNLPTDSFSLDQEAMTQIQIKLTQAIPFPGKLSLKKKAAEEEAEAWRLQVEETRLQLIRDVKKNWWEIFYLQKALEIVHRNQKLIHDIIDTARTKYQVGKGLQQDVLLAQVELSNLLNQDMEIIGLLKAQKAEMNRLLNQPQDYCFTLPSDFSAVLDDIPPQKDLLKVAELKRPILAVSKKKIDAAKNRLKLSRKGLFPDFTLGAAYGFRQGENPNGEDRADFASFMISMNLPVWAGTKQKKRIEEKSRELAESDLRSRETLKMVQAEISREASLYESAKGQALFYKSTIIPQARQTITAMIKGYQVNKVDFLNVIRAQLSLFNYEKKYWRMFTNGQKAMAALEAAIGTTEFPDNDQR